MTSDRSERDLRIKTVPVRRIKVAVITTVDMTLAYLLRSQLEALRAEGYEVTAISAPGPHVAAVTKDGIRHIPWRAATRGWSLRSDIRAFFELVGILRRERFDLVHTHNPKPGVLGRLAARFAGVPCVVNTVHGLYATPDDRPARKAAVLAVESVAARFSHAELYQSEEDLRWARKVRLSGGTRTVLLGNGVDLDVFDPAAVDRARTAALRRDLGIPAEALVVGAVGRLVVEKGYLELFQAAADIRVTHPDVRFLIIGEPDPVKWDSVGDAQMRAAPDNIVFAGRRDDVRDLLAIMDVFVLASWREGLPRSAVEAAAMGTAMVLTDIRGCREVARDGLEAILVPPRSPARLAAAIRSLLDDQGLRRRLGTAARKRALDRFDERRVVESVLREYRNLLGRAGLLTGTLDGFAVRRAARGDVASLARMHVETIHTGFLPTLGERFLRVLYRALVHDPDCVAIVVELDGRTVGFVTGALSISRFYRRFGRRYAIPAGLAVAGRLLRPATARRLIETIRYPDGSRGLPEAELISIGVDHAARRRGLGSALATLLVEELRDLGASEVRCTTGVGESMERMLAASGWRRAGEHVVHAGRTSVVFVT